VRDGCEGVGCEVRNLIGACFGGLREGGRGGEGLLGWVGCERGDGDGDDAGGDKYAEGERGRRIWFPESAQSVPQRLHPPRPALYPSSRSCIGAGRSRGG